MDLKTGTTPCTLDELCFPVEMIDNPNRTNREYSKIVTGVITERVPFFGEDQLKLMEESLSEDEIKKMISENPATKIVDSEIDLNYCSPRYELVPNDMIFPKVEEIFRDQGIEFKVDYSHTDHARFYGNFIVEDPRFAYKMKGAPNDVIKFLWSFQHSYNGITKYRGLCGFHREVCTNGLTVPVAEMEEYNLALEGKHTASILKSLDEFSQILVNVTDNLTEVTSAITERFETLGGRRVTKPEDRITEVLKASGIPVKEKTKSNVVANVMGRINLELDKNKHLGYDPNRLNDWLIYNGINQYINDDSLNIASPEKRRDKDSKVLEYMLEYA